eukprot:7558636-Pyramimonas_sp.AAC.1
MSGGTMLPPCPARSPRKEVSGLALRGREPADGPAIDPTAEKGRAVEDRTAEPDLRREPASKALPRIYIHRAY